MQNASDGQRLPAWANAICALIAIVGAGCLATLFWIGGGQHGAFGNADFIQYWSADALLWNKQNPYDPSLMLALQRSGGLTREMPIMMWNGPWLPILFHPLLNLPLEFATPLWGVVSLLLLLSASFLLGAVYGSRTNLWLCTFALALTFFPIVFSLQSGQLGAVLLFALSLTLYGLERDKPALSGAGIFLMLLKPHLFSLIFLAILFQLLRKKDFAPALVASGLFVSALAFLQWVNPHALADWRSLLSN